MRTCVPFLLLALTPYVSAETLPRYLNSNESIQNLPSPNLPVDVIGHKRLPWNYPSPVLLSLSH